MEKLDVTTQTVERVVKRPRKKDTSPVKVASDTATGRSTDRKRWNMDTEKVTQDLNKRFLAPLPDYYKRRIIFWFDEDREFEDKLDGVELQNARLVQLTGSNSFAIKKLLGQDEPYTNFVVYSPVSYPRLEDNWLLDVQLYSEEYRADLLSLWLEEMHIPSSTSMRKMLKGYRKFFNAKERRNRVAAMAGISTPAQLHLAVMAAVCGVKGMQPSDIVKAVLAAGLDIHTNPLYLDLVSYGAKDAFWAMVAQATGYSEADVDLLNLACQVMLTATTRTLKPEHLQGLERFIYIPHQAWCFDLVSDWLSAADRDNIYQIGQQVENAFHLQDRFEQLPVQELLETACFPCINACILTKLMGDIENDLIQVDHITSIVEKRRALAWYEEVSAYYNGVLQVANMQRFYLEHAASFHTVEGHRVWKEYTHEYYFMDTYYRYFHQHYADSLKNYDPVLSDHFAHVADKVEGLYVHWFLNKLAASWTNACEQDFQQFGRVLEVPEQKRFYQDKVAGSDNNVVVIISDALRYEVAASLAEKLRLETQGKVELESMQAVFPTITKYGMAALLPHKRLSVEERTSGLLSVLADGNSTDSLNRDEVLKLTNKNSIALQYKEIIGLKTDELRSLTTGMEIIYIYHDTIDTSSHASESLVFGACNNGIEELGNLVRIIINRMNRTRVIITADHGFLYTHQPLQEDSKVDKTSFNQMDVEYGRRYAIMRPEANPDYLMPVKFLDEASGFTAFTPRENIRIKMSGSGLNFVHGGVSLQELCVPVLTYHHLRSDNKEYQKNRSKYDTKPVSLELLSANRKISNMIFSLNFYQKEAVGGKRAEQTYQLYFSDEYGKVISDTQKVIADKTAEDNQERTFRISFNLRQMKFNGTANYYLVIADEQGLMNPQQVAFRIDIPFAVEEFDFFS